MRNVWMNMQERWTAFSPHVHAAATRALLKLSYVKARTELSICSSHNNGLDVLGNLCLPCRIK